MEDGPLDEWNLGSEEDDRLDDGLDGLVDCILGMSLRQILRKDYKEYDFDHPLWGLDIREEIRKHLGGIVSRSIRGFVKEMKLRTSVHNFEDEDGPDLRADAEVYWWSDGADEEEFYPPPTTLSGIVKDIAENLTMEDREIGRKLLSDKLHELADAVDRGEMDWKPPQAASSSSESGF
jgi:hypothetical protein